MFPESTESGGSWPPAPEEQPSIPTVSGAEDEVAEALHHGWRLLLLGLFCAPPVFLPLAVWQGVAAGKVHAGAGTALLLAAGGVSVFWLGAIGIAEYINH